MKILQIQPIFKIGELPITLPMILYAVFILVIILAIIAYRCNHRIQTGVSRFMDNESVIFNQNGLEKIIVKKARSFSNPTTMLVEIRNLSYLYTNYPYQSQLIYKITDVLLSTLDKKEFAGRIDFNKYIMVFNNKNKDYIKNVCIQIQENLDKIEFEEYGKFDFYVYFGIYESAPMKDENLILYTSEIINYSKISIANYYYYSIEVKESIERIKRMNLEKDYDFDQRRFVPYIQPKVDLTTGTVVGGEILVRWVDESQNYKYPPSEFIPLFEKNGFVSKVDEEMFRQACLLANVLVGKGHPDIKISVNISKLKFLSPDFEQSIIDIVNETHANPKNLVIEITETTVMENFQYVSNCIMKLRQFGFSVAMDDFGQEYSSLGSLSMNPFDIIKLDRVFFKNKLSTEKDRLIVRNLLEMLNDLNYKVVCEGISDKQTLDMLATINQSVIIQGYVISQPIPVSQFEAFVDTIYEFNYPPVDKNAPLIVEPVTESITENINIHIEDSNANGGIQNPDNNDKIDEMQRQMMEMERKFQQQLENQRREIQEAEMNRMREDMIKLKELNNKSSSSSYESNELESIRREILNLRNDSKKDSNNEIESLRREIEALRYQNLYYNKNNNSQLDYHRDDEMYRMRREIYDIKYQQERDRQRDKYDRDYYYERNNMNNDELGDIKKQIKEIKETQNNQSTVNSLLDRIVVLENNNNNKQNSMESETQSLKVELEKQKKEKEDLEKMLYSMLEEAKSKEKLIDDYEFDLDIGNLYESDDREDDYEDDNDGEEGESLSSSIRKPSLSLEEVKVIIAHFKAKFGNNWHEHAKIELKEGYFNLINDILYYKNKEKSTFQYKLKNASSNVKQIYNIVKNQLMKYSNISNKMVNGYDSFYIGRTQVAKLHLTSTKVKVFLAVNPNDYPERLFPHKDVSYKKVHSRTPYYTLVQSQLSVKRFIKVVEDMFANENVIINQHYKPIDYAKVQSQAYKSELD